MVEDRTSVHLSRHYDAPPETVYDAWVQPEQMRRFLFATPTGEIVRCDAEPVIGGKLVIVDRREGEDVEHVGEYLELDRPRRLAFTFAVPKYSPVITVVALDFEPAGTGCDLVLTHEGVLPEWADSTREGWTGILEGLAGVVQ